MKRIISVGYWVIISMIGIQQVTPSADTIFFFFNHQTISSGDIVLVVYHAFETSFFVFNKILILILKEKVCENNFIRPFCQRRGFFGFIYLQVCEILVSCLRHDAENYGLNSSMIIYVLSFIFMALLLDSPWTLQLGRYVGRMDLTFRLCRSFSYKKQGVLRFEST